MSCPFQRFPRVMCHIFLSNLPSQPCHIFLINLLLQPLRPLRLSVCVCLYLFVCLCFPEFLEDHCSLRCLFQWTYFVFVSSLVCLTSSSLAPVFLSQCLSVCLSALRSLPKLAAKSSHVNLCLFHLLLVCLFLSSLMSSFLFSLMCLL